MLTKEFFRITGKLIGTLLGLAICCFSVCFADVARTLEAEAKNFQPEQDPALWREDPTVSETRQILKFIPAAPKGFSAKEQYDWNKRHYLSMARQRHEAQKRHFETITKYDVSTFKAQDFGEFEKICKTPYAPTRMTTDGSRIKMLAVAFVNIDRAEGASAWGHAAERYIYCFNSEFHDELFEYLPLREELFDEISKALEEYHFDFRRYPKSYVQSLIFSLYVSFSERPFQGYYQAVQFIENRTIFEVWLKAKENTMYKMLLNNAKRYTQQKYALRDQKPLPRYFLLNANCTTDPAEDIKIINPAFLAKFHGPMLTPAFMYDYVRKMDVDRIVIYPSQRLWRLMKMKEGGESTFLENFASFSKASKGATHGWVFFYPESQSRWKQVLLKPIGGALNFGAAVVETVWAFVTLPLNIFGDIPGFGILKADSRGLPAIKAGLSDLLLSVAEIAQLRVRYEAATNWTSDEVQFIRGFDQTTVLLEYLRARYQFAPVIVNEPVNQSLNQP